jgi:hypothetical protein
MEVRVNISVGIRYVWIVLTLVFAKIDDKDNVHV